MHNPLWKRVLLKDWPQRLSAVIIGLFLFQFVLWIQKEDGLWLPETVALVSGSLGLMVLVDMVPGLRLFWRLLLQLMLVVGLHMTVLDYQFIGAELNGWKESVDWLALNGSQIEPFIWFSFMAWAIYLFATWAVQAKLRIMVLIVISVLFFAIRDSFSLIVLWPQVAGVLFCGFSLLILRHFSQLKQRAPVIWGTFMEHPTSIAAPIVFIIVCTLVVGAVSPTLNPILTDPYTAWKVKRGESVPQLGKGVTVSASEGDASSGYSREDGKLGGGFRFDYSPVMTVNTTKRTYLRGETRALYNGNGWQMSPEEKQLGFRRVNGSPLPADPRFDTSLLQTKEVAQNVVMEREDVFPVLFGGYMVQRVEEMNQRAPSFQQLVWSPRQAELRFNDKSNYPKSYRIIAQEPIIDEPGLREVKASYTQQPEWAEYLQLPQELPERVKQLALDITKTGDNSYDKAKLLEKYLAERYPYTNTPDDSKGKSKDFVDRFLFEVKQGYCDYYSTSMTVLARSIGLPARWVKGYSSGSSTTPDQTEDYGMLGRLGVKVDPDGAGSYIVRNSDAHSWVEIYFQGYGWIPFEPTSGYTLPNIFPEVPQEAIDLPASSEPVVAVPITENASSYKWLWTTAVTAAVVLMAAAVYVLLKKSDFWKAGGLFRKQARAINFNQKIIVEFEKLMRLGRRKGYRRHEHETMREATARWVNHSTWMEQDLNTLLLLFERAKYSQAHATEQDYSQASQLISKLKEQMK